MATAQFRVEPLGNHHVRTTFSCGKPALDRSLQRQARKDRDRHSAAVFVLIDPATGRVAGYSTLSAFSVRLAEIPPDIATTLPRYPDVPAILLGRLAIDTAYQGQRLGGDLLVNALRRAYCASIEAIGAAIVVVDAIAEEAAAFSERYGFQRFPEHPQRLFLPMRSVAAL